LLRVQDGRLMTAVPIYLPADAPLNVKEVPASASFTRAFVPESHILQREKKTDTAGWLWGAANLVVLLCSLAIFLGISVAVTRVGRRIEEHEAALTSDRAPTLTS
jgi:hypothetical protein